jgi:hypothetical protein
MITKLHDFSVSQKPNRLIYDKVFNRDVRIWGGWALYVNEIAVIDADWNIDAPVTSSDLTLTGSASIWTTLEVTWASTFTWACQNNSTITVWVDDTWYDVKFFWATASAYCLWDASEDDLVLAWAAWLSVAWATIMTWTLTTWVDDTWVDVKFFGATASAYCLWDESEDDLILAWVAWLKSIWTGWIWYWAWAWGTVTQATNKTTGVTLSKTTWTITTHNAELAAAAEATFVVTNTLVAITDTIVLSIQSGWTPWEYQATVTTVAAGSFQITLANLSGSAASDAVLINYTVIKGVAA